MKKLKNKIKKVLWLNSGKNIDFCKLMNGVLIIWIIKDLNKK